MNSLPFIPHHLFVAAISNQGHVCEKPARPAPRFFGPANSANVIALAVMNARKPVPEGATRQLRVSLNRAET